ncbi:tetratricopeptide repeat protein [candidate division WOR-3 bacterium]|nr:tetratricopeptide repeat protein [candidate division WOR-3 bacterium]
MTKHKITKKELKHDRFLDSTVEFMIYARHHKKIIGGIVVFIAVILIAVPYYQNYRRGIRDRADSKLMQAELAYVRGDFQDAYMEFETVRSNFSNTPAGKKAVYYTGHLMQLQGQPDEAIKYFEEFLSIYKDPILTPAALLGIASCKTQLGQVDEAMESYQETAEKFSHSYFAEVALMELADLKETSGDIEGAKEVLRGVVSTFANTDVAKEAEEKIAFLEGMGAVSSTAIPPDIQIDIQEME